MLNFIHAHWQGLSGAAVAGVAIIAMLPVYVEANIKSALDYIYEHGDADDDKLLAGITEWAHAKFGKLPATDRAMMVVQRIVSWIPLPYRLAITSGAQKMAAEILQRCFERADAAAMAEAKEHCVPLQPDAVPQAAPVLPVDPTAASPAAPAA